MFQRTVISVLLLVLCYCEVQAQATKSYTSPVADYEHGKMLYLKEQYVAAITDFTEFLKNTDDASLAYEAKAYIELSRLHLDKKNAANNLVDLIKDHPEHKLNSEIVFELGLYYFREEKYKRALRYLEQIQEREVSPEQRDELIFKKGYSYFQDEEYGLAKAEFLKILGSQGPYGIQANYYYGYQCYILKDYQCALSTFEKIGDKGPKTMQIYIAQIYYEQEKYDLAFEHIKDLHIEARKNDIELLKGKIQYQLGNYSIALTHFEAYEGNTEQLSPDELFQFAHSYYLAERFKESTPYFLRIANREDEIGQAANYHLGVSDVSSGEKARAMNAFAEARRKNYDPHISELSAFNYAKLAAELNQNNVAITALRSFMTEYPESEMHDEAQNLMASIYLSTKNYKAAISMIESIRNLDENTKSAYQILTFHRAEELYLNKEYKESAIYFGKSLKYTRDKELEARAHFWLGQIAFLEKDYDQSISELLSFVNNGASSKCDERNYAYYCIGYNYLKKSDYQKAIQYFNQYKKLVTYSGDSKRQYLDNQLRLADSYFKIRQYNDAIKAYGDAINLNYKSADYALYQQGILYGLIDNTDLKISTLRKIQKDFSGSVYYDDALYQIGREYMEAENYEMAENMFKLLISQHDHSKYLADSYLKLGLIYYNQNKDDIALGHYKTVVERFPKTTASREALAFIELIYVKQGRADEWVAYAASHGTDIRMSQQDSLMYESAMIKYRDKDCIAAVRNFKAYIEKFGNSGYFIIPVNYYKAECDFYNGRQDEALTHYEFVVKQNTSEWSEKATIKLAETYFSRKQYEKSLDYFASLEALASNKTNFINSLLGQMRCYYLLKDFEKAKEKAIEILPIESVPREDLVETNMLLGRIQYRDGNLRTAKFHFDYVVNNSRNVVTAEAIYNRAQILFEQNELDSSRTDIYRLNDDFSAYEFWVVKGFILLSDIYVKEEDYFQAKATLQSIIDNYKKEDDGLLDICRMKLKEIERLDSN